MAEKTLQINFRPTGADKAKSEIQSVGMSVEQITKKMKELKDAGVDLSKTSFAGIAKQQERYRNVLNPGPDTSLSIGNLKKLATGGLQGKDVMGMLEGEAGAQAIPLIIAHYVTKQITAGLSKINDLDKQVALRQISPENARGQMVEGVARSIPGFGDGWGLGREVRELFTHERRNDEVGAAKIKQQQEIRELTQQFFDGITKAIRSITENAQLGFQQHAATRHSLSFGDLSFQKGQADIEDTAKLEKAHLGQDKIDKQRGLQDDLMKTINGILKQDMLSAADKYKAIANAKADYTTGVADLDKTNKKQLADVDLDKDAKLKEQQRAATKAFTEFQRQEGLTHQKYWAALSTQNLQLMGRAKDAEFAAIDQKYNEEGSNLAHAYDEMMKTVSPQQAKILDDQKKFYLADLENRRTADKKLVDDRRKREKDEDQRQGVVASGMLALRMGTTYNQNDKRNLGMQQTALTAFKQMQAEADAVMKSKDSTAAERKEAMDRLELFRKNIGATIAQQNPLEQKKLSDSTQQMAMSGFNMASKDWETSTRNDYQKQLVGENKALNDKLAGIDGTLRAMLMQQKEALARYDRDRQ